MQLSVWFDFHVVHLTYININMDIVNILISTVRTIRQNSLWERKSSQREVHVVGSSLAVGNNLSFVILAFFACLTTRIS